MTLTAGKFKPGAPFPEMVFKAVGGGEINLSAESGWRLLVVYRGKHCPACKRYFARLGELQEDYKAAGISVWTVSADPLEKAQADVEAEGWRFPVGYDLSMDQMRALGLYISQPRSPEETDRPFSEPGVFVINPQGQVQIIDISNVPSARPDLEGLLNGIKYIIKMEYGPRGTLS